MDIYNKCVYIAVRPTVFVLFTCEDEALLVRRNALAQVLNFCFYVVDRVRSFYVAQEDTLQSADPDSQNHRFKQNWGAARPLILS